MRQEQTWCASKREGRPEDPGHGEQEEIEGQRGGQSVWKNSVGRPFLKLSVYLTKGTNQITQVLWDVS